MAAPVDLTGRKFGRLTVLRRSEKRAPASGRKARERGWTLPLWECVCDCGAPVLVTASKLASGNTQSCGCLQREKAATSGRAATSPTKPKKCRLCGEPFVGTNKQRYCCRDCKELDALPSPLTPEQRQRKREYLARWKQDRAVVQLAQAAGELKRRAGDGGSDETE